MSLTCELQGDVTRQGDQTEGGEQVVEGEVVGEEPAVLHTLIPTKSDIILNKERRDDTAIDQVGDGHCQND